MPLFGGGRSRYRDHASSTAILQEAKNHNTSTQQQQQQKYTKISTIWIFANASGYGQKKNGIEHSKTRGSRGQAARVAHRVTMQHRLGSTGEKSIFCCAQQREYINSCFIFFFSRFTLFDCVYGEERRLFISPAPLLLIALLFIWFSYVLSRICASQCHPDAMNRGYYAPGLASDNQRPAKQRRCWKDAMLIWRRNCTGINVSIVMDGK